MTSFCISVVRLRNATCLPWLAERDGVALRCSEKEQYQEEFFPFLPHQGKIFLKVNNEIFSNPIKKAISIFPIEIAVKLVKYSIMCLLFQLGSAKPL